MDVSSEALVPLPLATTVAMGTTITGTLEVVPAVPLVVLAAMAPAVVLSAAMVVLSAAMVVVLSAPAIVVLAAVALAVLDGPASSTEAVPLPADSVMLPLVVVVLPRVSLRAVVLSGEGLLGEAVPMRVTEAGASVALEAVVVMVGRQTREGRKGDSRMAGHMNGGMTRVIAS